MKLIHQAESRVFIVFELSLGPKPITKTSIQRWKTFHLTFPGIFFNNLLAPSVYLLYPGRFWLPKKNHYKNTKKTNLTE